MNGWGYEITEISDKDVQALTGSDIVAFQFAEPGAMGYHGGIFFVTSDSKLYFTCYLKPSDYSGNYAGMSWENLLLVFPPLKDFNHGFAGHGVISPEGWEYEYLGCGNHLLVKQSFWEEFTREAKRLLSEQPDTILYNQWMEATLNILKAGPEVLTTSHSMKKKTVRIIAFAIVAAIVVAAIIIWHPWVIIDCFPAEPSLFDPIEDDFCPVNSVRGHAEREEITGKFDGKTTDTLRISFAAKTEYVDSSMYVTLDGKRFEAENNEDWEYLWDIKASRGTVPDLRVFGVRPLMVFEGDLDQNGTDEFGILFTWQTSACRTYEVYTFHDGQWRWLIPQVRTAESLRASGKELVKQGDHPGEVKVT
ncbi:MAG: hypothetical protein IJ584_01260, partial [Bacteroidales bacterium]|nr:hypothetical protein [Bacteroidales bacterium]